MDKVTVHARHVVSPGLALDYTDAIDAPIGRDVFGGTSTRSKSEIRDNEVSPWYLSGECPAPENISVSVTT